MCTEQLRAIELAGLSAPSLVCIASPALGQLEPPCNVSGCPLPQQRQCGTSNWYHVVAGTFVSSLTAYTRDCRHICEVWEEEKGLVQVSAQRI